MRDDLTAAIRSIISARGVTIAAVAVLTLGIGAGTAIFSVVDAVVLRGLPFDRHDRLVAIGERTARVDAADPDALLAVAPQNYLDWAARQQAFSSIAAIASGWLTLQEPGGEPESLVPQHVTASFFDVLQVRPALGRAFTAAREVEGSHRVVVLSDALWRRRFGADPGIVGRAIRLQDVQGDVGGYEVAGVMPPGFTYPVGASRATDLWLPYVVPAAQRVRSDASRVNYLQVIARLSPGASLGQAQQQMNAIASALQQEHPQWNKDNRIGVRPLVDHVVGARMRSWMLMLLGAVALVLLIACANVANLLLVRAASRTREMGIRVALGAGRLRLVRQLLLESLILAAASTVCALLLGWWTLGVLVASLPPDLPRVSTIALNLRVLATTSIVACAAGVIFGVAPALQLSRPDITSALREGGQATASRRRQRLRGALVVGEVALAVVLLVGAVLFIASFVSLMRIAPGFDPAHVLTAQVSPRVEQRPDGQFVDRRAGLADAVDRIGRVPGVVAAAMVSGGLPFGGATSMSTLQAVEGVMLMEPINVRSVTPDYARAIGLPLRAGRFFAPGDTASAPQVVVLNESAARRFFPGKDPIGRLVTLGADRTVVGVVADIHQRSLEMEPWREAYIPMAQSTRPITGAELAVRVEGNPSTRLPAVRAAAFAAFPDVPLRNVAAMDDLVARPMAQRRLNMLLLGLFGLLGLVIATIGIYGVMAHAVAQRTAEIGVRMALGATRANVLGLVMRQAISLVACGLILGSGAAWYLRAFAAAFLFNVKATDLRVLGLALAVIAVSAVAASLLPARRASRVDAVIALRA
jgi:putative ABC transport system permease protein